MRGSQLVAIISVLISGALAAGYFFFYNKAALLNTVAASAYGSAFAFNPKNQIGMIVILGVMIALSVIVAIRRRDYIPPEVIQK